MKKIFAAALALFVVFGITACSGDTAKDCKVTTVLVTDTTGIDDKSFNQGAYEGLEKFAKEYKDEGACNASNITANTDSESSSAVASVSGKDNQLVVAAGFTFENAIKDNAKQFPDQKFLLIDDVVDAPNVVSAIFAANQGSFLAGVAAAEKAKEAGKDKVAFIGGMKGPVIKGFEVGYVQGVKAVDPKMKVDVQYVGDFSDSSKAKTMALNLYNNGTYIIFVAAGGAGNGVINAAQELARDDKKEVWVIGVDKDQYKDGEYDGDKSIILTSMVKRADVASFDVAKSVLENKFEGGKTITYDLKSGAVGLPDENPNLSENILKIVDEYKAKIIEGKIVVQDA